jgi:hypothetical protein
VESRHLSQPISLLIKSVPALNDKLGPDYKKVNKHLKRYARTLQRDADQLTLLDICDERGEIQPQLVETVYGRPRKKGCSDEQFNVYSGQILSRLRRFPKIIALLVKKDGADRASSDQPQNLGAGLLDKVPEPLKPVLVQLPRTCGPRIKEDQRLAYPLAKFGLLQLQVLLNVWEKFSVTSPKELFVDHWRDLKQEWRAICDPGDIRYVNTALRILRLKAGFPIKLRPGALKWDEVPPRLREQLETYKAKAPSGAKADQELCRLARSKGGKLRSQRERTIRKNCENLLLLLARIPVTENMEITDLIRIESKVVIEDGEETDKLYNPYIEVFREDEKSQETPSKAKDFDSRFFGNAISAIKSIAAFNGVLRFYKKFSEAYKPNFDVDTMDTKKSKKKEVFTIDWVDYNLSRLRPQFEKIIKEGTFKIDADALDLCLCYLYLITLRFTGGRQQCLRNCRIGWNVEFHKKGRVITFHWRPDEIKNKVDLRTTITPTQVHTFGALNKALWLYYDHVYPFLEERCREQGGDPEGQLFLEVTAKGVVRPFPRLSSSRFSQRFNKLTEKFLDFTGIEHSMRGSFNPHHIRGLFADWIDKDIGMGAEAAARSQGNDLSTTERSYLARKRIDNTLLFAEVEERAARNKSRDTAPDGVFTVGNSEATYQARITALTEEMAARDKRHAEELDVLQNTIRELIEKIGEKQAA